MTDPASEPGLDFEQIYRAVARIVEEEYPLRLTQRDIARRLGCAPVTVREAYARFGGGLTLRGQLREVRLGRGAELLRLWPDVRIRDIAHTVGYPSYNHFTREFVLRFGMTPAAHRFGAFDDGPEGGGEAGRRLGGGGVGGGEG
jgi:AraC-like DNA-binding protein